MSARIRASALTPSSRTNDCAPRATALLSRCIAALHLHGVALCEGMKCLLALCSSSCAKLLLLREYLRCSHCGGCNHHCRSSGLR